MDQMVVGNQNQPNHVQMERYYNRGRSKAGLKQLPVCQCVEGMMGCALEKMGDG
jgi:hypothetical protein